MLFWCRIPFSPIFLPASFFQELWGGITVKVFFPIPCCPKSTSFQWWEIQLAFEQLGVCGSSWGAREVSPPAFWAVGNLCKCSSSYPQVLYLGIQPADISDLLNVCICGSMSEACLCHIVWVHLRLHPLPQPLSLYPHIFNFLVSSSWSVEEKGSYK